MNDDIGSQMNIFGNGKKPNGNKVLFWLPFVFLLLVSVVFFTFSKNTIIGYVLLAASFIVILFIKKFLSRLGLFISIISWILILIIIFVIYTFTLPNKHAINDNATKSATGDIKNSSFKNIQFSKSYTFPNNKGTYTININTQNDHYILEITVKVPKETLPKGFKWNPDLIKEKEPIIGGAAFDYLYVYWKSVNKQPSLDRLDSFTGWDVYDSKSKSHTLKDCISKTSFERQAYTFDQLKEIMQAGDKLELLWFNINEVGLTDIKEIKNSDGSISKNGRVLTEKGYGLHPNLAETIIPWDSILKEIGL